MAKVKKGFAYAVSELRRGMKLLFGSTKVTSRGLDKLLMQVDRERAKTIDDMRASVLVGYSTRYAVYVHEDLTQRHQPGKMGKFLERPARWYRKQMSEVVIRSLKQNRTFSLALLRAGAYLQRESQKIVPIDTGLLRQSAFTRLD